MHRVVVSVEDAKTAEQAVSMVSNMLNGCYPPGVIMYPVESLSSYVNRKTSRKFRKLASNKQLSPT